MSDNDTPDDPWDPNPPKLTVSHILKDGRRIMRIDYPPGIIARYPPPPDRMDRLPRGGERVRVDLEESRRSFELTYVLRDADPGKGEIASDTPEGSALLLSWVNGCTAWPRADGSYELAHIRWPDVTPGSTPEVEDDGPEP